jgi:hypothetical protein
MAQSLASGAPDLGARIIITPLKNTARWIGTRAQLEAEGFIPEGQAWPEGNKHTSWKIGDVHFFIHCGKTTRNDAIDADHQYRINSHLWDGKCHDRAIRAKAVELAALVKHGGPEWSANWERHFAARQDKAFQEFKRNLLGQKRRGKPTAQAKATRG